MRIAAAVPLTEWLRRICRSLSVTRNDRLLEGVPGDYGRTQLRLSPEPLYNYVHIVGVTSGVSLPVVVAMGQVGKHSATCRTATHLAQRE